MSVNQCSWCLTPIESANGFCHRCDNSLPPVTGEPTATPWPKPKDPEIAFILELLPGIAGFLGIGWAYSVSQSTGILLMVSWWSIFALLIATLVWIARTTGTIGVLAILPFVMTIGIGIPVFSALRVKQRVRNRLAKAK